MSTAERVPDAPVEYPQPVEHVSQTPEIPYEVEHDTGMQAVPQDDKQFQVTTDDQGTHTVQPQDDTTVTVTVPYPEDTLQHFKKEDTEEASTWWGVYWLRQLQKAVAKGYKVVIGES